MIKIHVVFVFISLLFVSTTSAEESRILSVAKKIPASAKTIVSIIDIAAAREQIHPFIDHQQPGSEVAHFELLPVIFGIDLRYMIRFSVRQNNTFKDMMGFEFGAIDGLATWSSPSETSVIAEFSNADDLSDMASALKARNFALRESDKVWYYGKDFELDFSQADEDPFSAIGKSARFKQDKATLYYAVSFKGIEAQIATTPRLIDSDDFGGLMAAIDKVKSFGPPIGLIWFSADIKAGDNDCLAIISWQKGDTTTKAIAWVYHDTVKARASVEKPLFDSLPENFRKGLVSQGISSFGPQIVENGKVAVVLWFYQ